MCSIDLYMWYTLPDADGTALYTAELYYIRTYITWYTPPMKRLGVVYRNIIIYTHIYYITTYIHCHCKGREVQTLMRCKAPEW